MIDPLHGLTAAPATRPRHDGDAAGAHLGSPNFQGRNDLRPAHACVLPKRCLPATAFTETQALTRELTIGSPKDRGVRRWHRSSEGKTEGASNRLRNCCSTARRGLEEESSLVIGDRALGFWKAMRQVWDKTKEPRCWVRKMANILDKLPKGAQPNRKGALHEIYGAESKGAAEKALDLFVKTYGAKYPKSTECLEKDKEDLLAF
ncbi:transposase [Singulisphaera rosea]